MKIKVLFILCHCVGEQRSCLLYIYVMYRPSLVKLNGMHVLVPGGIWPIYVHHMVNYTRDNVSRYAYLVPFAMPVVPALDCN